MSSLSPEPENETREPLAASPLQDLARRWKRARREALRTIAVGAREDADEGALLGMALAVDAEAAAKRVFDNSRVLGLGFRRYRGVDLTMVDLAAVLPVLGAPCLRAGFRRDGDEPACRSAGSPCSEAAEIPGWCDHWRESLHGLVGGLSSSVYYTRVESPAHGGSSCVDLLHVHADTQKRFTPIGPELQAGLDAVSRLIHDIDAGATLEFLGLVEGALHYRVKASPRDCGTCGLDVAALLPRALRRKFPELRLSDASPRPVLSP